MSISNVVIVGGGTAGWIVAGVLASRYANEGDGALNVTLVESPDVATVGVGEGTWPSMRTTLQGMGISETDFMRECDVSLKQGSRFDNWQSDQDSHYYHPYSLPTSYGEFNLASYWQNVKGDLSFSHAVSPQSALCDLSLAPKQISTPEYAFNVNYGYHLDATKFANFLQKHCVDKLGVTHVLGHVESISNHENDDIDFIKLSDGRVISGQLFIDCTGFSSILIGKHYGIEVESLQHTLFNDSALVGQLKYENPQSPIASHTRATALSAGWVWDIGLSSRRGIGYVYSSSHISDEQAHRDLHSYLLGVGGAYSEATFEPRKLTFKPGYRKKFWHKNCVAIGLSAGFVEPLEATAIALVEQSAKMIADNLPHNRDVMNAVANRFNCRSEQHWLRIVDFLKLHYVLSQREGRYWIDHRSVDSVPDSLSESLALWQYQAPWVLDAPNIDEMFPSASYQYILYGMGFKTIDSSLALRQAKANTSRAATLINENLKQANRLQKAMPSNRDLLGKVRDHGFQKI